MNIDDNANDNANDNADDNNYENSLTSTIISAAVVNFENIPHLKNENESIRNIP